MIGQIEQAIIDRARGLSDSGALGYKLGQAATYAGQFDEGFKEVARHFPLMFVAWSGEWAPPQYLGDNRWQYRPIFALILAARSLRNEKAARHGAAGEVGSYQLLGDMRAAFTGRRLGLDIRAFEPGGARSLFNSRIDSDKMSVLAMELRTEYAVDLLDESDPGDFETFHADWDIPPSDGHASVPVPDGEADATDEITLETE